MTITVKHTHTHTHTHARTHKSIHKQITLTQLVCTLEKADENEEMRTFGENFESDYCVHYNYGIKNDVTIKAERKKKRTYTSTTCTLLFGKADEN